ncbi:MAG: polysaccharide deacetylase family protein, partial [Lentisphaerae bacterium]|nr:polysaccharide deacetylase family protein [Lentisphaerota bacterium]
HYKSWMLFLGIVLLLVAFFQPIKIWIRKAVFKPPVTSPVRVAREFVALAYSGVEDSPAPGSPNVSTDMFKEQMRLLAEGGYNPITLQDVRDFYKEGKLLPHRAVLITFEQAKRGTYNAVREILQARGWPAVMGVNTLAVQSMNQETLVWHHLREMKALGFWELAAESHLGFNPIETVPYDAEATFFTSPKWIAAENRYETREEFETRIAEDHATVLAEFERETKSRPLAFFFPLGNYGQYDERAQMVRAVNLGQVERNYDLGFIVGMLALNAESSDPRRLNRLLVNPSWSPNAFISMIDSFWPRPWTEANGRSAVYNAASWLGDWGEVVARNDVLVLKAVQPLDLFDTDSAADGTTGAKAWLVGSDTFKDGTVSFLFNMRHGRFGVYLRSTNRGEYVFVGIDERGYVSARQKLQDVDELILGMDTLPTDVSVSHNLSVTLRDNLMFVHVDGKLMFGGRVLLRGASHAGLIGASVWDPLVGVASTEIISTRIAGRRDAIVTWSPASGRNIGHLNTWLAANAHRFAILA